MADNGWGAARPEEYIEEGSQGGFGQQSAVWSNGQATTFMQAPAEANLPIPHPSQIPMDGVSGKQTGSVKTWISEKGFGFITKSDGTDVFVHHSAVHAQGKASLEIGENVEFTQVIGDDGRSKAEDVTGPGGVHVKGCSQPNYGGSGGTACRNFQSTGSCRFGMSCRFMHGSGGSDGMQSGYGRGGGGGASYGGDGGSGFGGSGKKPCFNFQNNGHCKFGDRCRFGHE